MFKKYGLIIIASGVVFVLLTTAYYYFKSEKLTIDVENQEVQLEVAKDEVKVEVLETKWETIANEHNKSLGDENYEIKTPVNRESNITDFFFSGMFS
jgi:hypothetical protein